MRKLFAGLAVCAATIWGTAGASTTNSVSVTCQNVRIVGYTGKIVKVYAPGTTNLTVVSDGFVAETIYSQHLFGKVVVQIGTSTGLVTVASTPICI